MEGQQKEEAAREREKERQEETLRQVRKDLEDTTGFRSYEAYVESLFSDPMYAGNSYMYVLDGLFHGPKDIGPGVDIIDVSNEDHFAVGVSLRCEDLSASEVSGALCHPPSNTRAQIVLWPFDTSKRNIENFLDVLGVGLRLDPWFFEALRWREDETRYSQYFRSRNSLCVRSIGTSVFVARSFVLAQANAVPIVLIAGPMCNPIRRFSNLQDPSKAIYDIVQAAPPYYHYKCDHEPQFANAYIRVLYSFLKSAGDSALSSSDILSACIIPLLQVKIAVCREDLGYLTKEFRKLKGSYSTALFKTRYWNEYERPRDSKLRSGEAPETLYRYRTMLRSWIEDFENDSGALMGFLSSLYGGNVTERLFHPQIREESTSIAEEARRLEAEIRDHLQLQGSKLALEESKKSVELSSHQIEESKRVKIFTILAFFYVPLNLATSVFGMNLEQLNGSGRSIGIFLGTAGTLLLVTGALWLLLEGVQHVRVYLRRPQEDRRRVPSQRHNIFIRLYLIWWLSRNGLFKWMIRTGAGWCLLTNSSLVFEPFGPHIISGAALHSTSESNSLSNLRSRSAVAFVLVIMSDVRLWRSTLNNDRRAGWYVWHNGIRHLRINFMKGTHKARM